MNAKRTSASPLGLILGVWRGDAPGTKYPLVRSWLGPRAQLEPQEHALLLAYLEGTPAVALFTQKVVCRVCAKDLAFTTKFHGDGTWGWTGTIAHYLREHQLWLPEAFLAHCRARAFVATTAPLTRAQRELFHLPMRFYPASGEHPLKKRGARALAAAK